MEFLRRFTFRALLSLGAISPAFAGEMRLAVRGATPEYAIVLPEPPSPSQRYAAEELRDFTEKMTGVRLPIVPDSDPLPPKAILLGETRYTDALLARPAAEAGLGPDGFRLVARPPHLLVVGSAERGALYGVYELLERFGGCRWYSSWCSKIPSLDVFSVPDDLDDIQTPAFESRDVGWADVFDHPVFAARLKLNTRAWKGKNEERLGGAPCRFAGGTGPHSFKKYLPPKEYFADHPDYFGMKNGVRTASVQICLTNPEALAIAASNLLARLRADPKAKLVSVSQDDGVPPCQCPACLAVEAEEGAASGPIIRYVNAMAEAVEREFPDVMVHTFAYNYSKKPPARTRARRNVVVQLCDDGCDFARPIRGNGDPRTAAFAQYLDGWSKMADKLWIWHYSADFRDLFLPFPNAMSLQDDLRLFREKGATMMLAQGNSCGRHGDFAELKSWLLAKWMWNPDLPVEPLLDDFFDGYFGAAAPFARRVFAEAHRRVAGTDAAGRPYTIDMYDWFESPALDADFLDEACELWRKAEEAARDDPGALHNVRMAAFGYASLRLDRMCRVLDFTGRPTPLAEAKELAGWLLACYKEAGGPPLNETGNLKAKRLAMWNAIAAADKSPTVSAGAGATGEVQAACLDLWAPGYWGDFVSDDEAGGAKVLKLYGKDFYQAAWFPMRQVGFEPGRKYRLRIHARVDAQGDGEAFWAGLWNPWLGDRHDAAVGCGPGDARRCEHMDCVPCAAPSTAEVPAKYAWFDIATWVPDDADLLWIGAGRFKAGEKSAVKAVFIDKIDFAPVKAGDMRLAVRGAAPDYAIVLPEPPSPSQRYAAEELRDFTEKMTGVRLSIVPDSDPLPPKAILLGETRHTAALLNEQVRSPEFKVQSSAGEPPAPSGGAASGRARRDAAPPISSPDSKTPELQEAKATTVKPSNCQTNYSGTLRALGPDGFRLVARPPHLLVVGSAERGTLYGVYELLERFGGCRWYSSWCSKIPSLDVFAVPDDLDDIQTPTFESRDVGWADVFNNPVFAARLKLNTRAWKGKNEERLGGAPYRFAGGTGPHSFKKYLPPKEYFADHPEYFGMKNGVRTANVQICLTNPEALAIAASNLLARLRADPEAKLVSVSQDDDWNRCQCTNCLAVEAEEGAASGPIMRYVNAMAEAVEREFPDVMVHTFAYNYSKKPPARTRARRNVVVQLCDDGCDPWHAIRSNSHKKTAAFAQYLDGWSKMTDKLWIWHYSANFWDLLIPFPNTMSLQDDLRLFREKGATMMLVQGNSCGYHGDFAELKSWLLAKWMWNPDQPMEPLLDDFFNGYFGAAAPFARRVFDLEHEKPGTALDADFVAEATELWRKGEEAVLDDPGSLYNVRMASFPIDQLRFNRAYRAIDLSGAGKGDDAVARETAATLIAKLREARPVILSEIRPNSNFTLRWEHAVRRAQMAPDATCGEVEDLEFDTWGGAARRVDDPGADDGHAIRVVPPCDAWIVRFPKKRATFKPDTKYRVRVRLRAEFKDGKADGNVFRAGIEPGQGAHTMVKASDLSEGYAWYDVAVWMPRGDDFLWMSPAGSATIYIDKIDFAPEARATYSTPNAPCSPKPLTPPPSSTAGATR